MQDYPIFARKMPEFYVIIARKNICSRILGVRAPVSYAYVDRQYKRHYAAHFIRYPVTALPKQRSLDPCWILGVILLIEGKESGGQGEKGMEREEGE